MTCIHGDLFMTTGGDCGICRLAGAWREARPGTVDMAPRLATNQKASIVADAAVRARTKLEADYGRKGDLQTLARLVNVPATALAVLYDEIAKTAREDR